MIIIRSYRVNEIHEEDDCPNCGNPVFVGEYAYETVDDDGPVDTGFCSKSCARVHANLYGVDLNEKQKKSKHIEKK